MTNVARVPPWPFRGRAKERIFFSRREIFFRSDRARGIGRRWGIPRARIARALMPELCKLRRVRRERLVDRPRALVVAAGSLTGLFSRKTFSLSLSLSRWKISNFDVDGVARTAFVPYTSSVLFSPLLFSLILSLFCPPSPLPPRAFLIPLFFALARATVSRNS